MKKICLTYRVLCVILFFASTGGSKGRQLSVTQANAGKDSIICSNSLVLYANAPGLNETGGWIKISGSGIFSDATSPTSNLTTIGQGVNIFSWTITNQLTLESSTDTIVITNSSSSQSIAGPAKTVCSSNTVLAGNAPVYGSGKWSLVSGSGTIANPLQRNAAVTALGPGPNVFRWTITNAGCQSDSTMVVTYDVSNAGPAQTVCADTAQLSASSSPVGIPGTWSDFPLPGFGAGDFDDPSNPNTIVRNLDPGQNTFLWTTSTGCPSAVIITNNTPTIANAGTDQMLCTDSTYLNANVPSIGTGKWNKLSGSGILANSNLPGSKVTNLNVGKNGFAWVISNGVCISQDTLYVINQSPSKAVAGGNQVICNDTTYLNATPPAQGTGVWTLVSGNGYITNNTQANTQVANLAIGTNTFVWTTSNASCLPSVDTAKVVKNIPVHAYAGPDKSICTDTVYLSANTQQGTGLWRRISGSGIIQTPGSPVTLISNLSDGISTFEWQFQITGCSPTKDTVVITKNSVTAASTGSNQVLCTDSTVLTGNVPVKGVGKWKFISGGGVLKDTLNPNAKLTNLFPNVSQLTWTITNANCTSQATISITNNKPTQAKVVTPGKVICLNADTLKAQPVVIGTAKWLVAKGGGVIASPNTNISPVTQVLPGSNKFVWYVSNNGCISTDTMTLINGIATKANAGTDTFTCQNNYTLQGNLPSQGTGTWSFSSGSGTFVNPNNPVTQVNNLQNGNNVLIWTISTGLCTSSKDSIVLSNRTVTISQAGNDTCIIIPSGTTTTISLNGNAPNTSIQETGYWNGKYPQGSTINFSPSANSTNPIISNLSTGYYNFTWNISDKSFSCISSATRVVNIIPQSGALHSQCILVPSAVSSTPVNLITANNLKPGLGEQGRWSFAGFISSVKYTPLPTAFDSVDGTVTLGKGVVSYRYTVLNTNYPGCQSVSYDTVTVLTEANAGTSQCVTNNFTTLSAVPPNKQVGGIGYWSALGTASVVGYPTGNVTGLNFGINKFILVNYNINYSSCKSYDTTSVTLLTKPNAGNDTFLVVPNGFQGSLKLNANSANTAANESSAWSVVTGSSPQASFDTISSPRATVSGLSQGVNSLVWKIYNPVSGCSLYDTMNIVVLTKANAGTSLVLTNANPGTALSATLTSPNTLQTTQGETGSWSFVRTTASAPPVFTSPVNAKTVNIGSLRRGVHTFKWTVSNTNFPAYSNYSTVTITVLTKAVAGSNICLVSTKNTVVGNTSKTLKIRPGVGEDYVWTCNNPSIVITPILADSVPASSVANLPIGNTKFYLRIFNTNNGASNSDSLMITNVQTAKIGNDTAICGTTYQAIPLYLPDTLLGEIGKWAIVYGNGVFTGSKYNPLITGIDTGKNAYSYSISNGSCMNADTLFISDNAPRLATIIADTNTCFTSNNITGNNPLLQFASAKGRWSIISQPVGNPAKILNDSAYATQMVNMTAAGDYIFSWSVYNKGCGPVADTAKIRRDVSIKVVYSGKLTDTICDTFYTMKATKLNPPAFGVWSLISGGGTIQNTSSPNTVIYNLPIDTNVYVWNVTNGACHGSVSVAIIRNQEPTLANATSAISICQSDSLVLYGNTPVVGSPYWSVLSGGAHFSNAMKPVAWADSLTYGMNKFTYSISNGVCPVSVDTIQVTRYQNVTHSNAGLAKQICSDTFHLQANVPLTGTGRWYNKSSLPAQLADSSNAYSMVLFKAFGNYIFEWKIVNGTCSDSSFVNLSVGQNVSKAIAGSDTVVCDTGLFSVHAITPLVGSGKWISISTSNKILNDTLPVTQVAIESFGNNRFVWSVSKSFCASYDTMVISNSRRPSIANAGPDTSSCQNNINLNARIPVNGMGVWKVLSPNLVLSDSASIHSLVSNLIQGSNKVIWKVSTAACPPSIDTLHIQDEYVPAQAAGNNQNVCADSAVLSAVTPVTGYGVWSVASGSAVFAGPANPQTSVSGLGPGPNKLVWTLVNNNCPNVRDTIVVANNQPSPVQPFPNISSYNPSIQLNASKPANGRGKWIVIQGKGVLDDPFNPNATISRMGNGTNIVRWSVTGPGCDSTYADQYIFINSLQIPNGFSPNNDNYNQRFEIRGIQDFPNSSLEVFNRWGNVVYQNPNYNNEWEGTSASNEALNDDTYYYVLKLSDGSVHKGYIVIKR